jgi:signal transduction histidine kinase
MFDLGIPGTVDETARLLLQASNLFALTDVVPGVWDRFKWIIIGGAVVVLAQALLIGALLVSRAKRRRAEESLRQNVIELDAARSALSHLSRRLMDAQEQERTRVARELHDDVSQRMTILAADLAQLRQTLSSAEAAAQGKAKVLYDAVIELSRDVQGISRRLHSSRIDLLGLAAAAEDLCSEISSHNGPHIEYIQENVPATLPEGVAISVFRVLQEALSNAVKHSGARHCRVTLKGSTDTLNLEVTDDGRGFDVEARHREHGLGLISMEERLNLVNGTLVIASKAGAGTTVRGSVPITMYPRLDGRDESSSDTPQITRLH